MKSWHRLTLVVVGLLAGTAAVEAQTTLRFQFKESEKLNYALDQKMKMSMDLMGQAINMNINQAMSMTWHILKVDSNGAAQVKMVITGMKMEMDGPMGKTEVDSKNPKQLNDPVGMALSQAVDAIAGMEMTFTMDGTGDIKDMKIPENTRNKLKNLPGSEALGDMLSDENLVKMAGGGFSLPKEAVTKGKTWTKKADIKMAMASIKADVQFTYDGDEVKNDKKLAKISLQPKVTVEASPNAPFQMKLKDQEGKGYMFFDNGTGRLIEGSTTQVMDFVIAVNDMNMAQKVEQVTVMKLVK